MTTDNRPILPSGAMLDEIKRAMPFWSAADRAWFAVEVDRLRQSIPHAVKPIEDMEWACEYCDRDKSNTVHTSPIAAALSKSRGTAE